MEGGLISDRRTSASELIYTSTSGPCNRAGCDPFAGKGAESASACPRYLGDDAAELGPVLREGQQVADGTADGVDAVRRLDLFNQDLRG